MSRSDITQANDSQYHPAATCTNLLERITKRYDPAFSDELRARAISPTERAHLAKAGLLTEPPPLPVTTYGRYLARRVKDPLPPGHKKSGRPALKAVLLAVNEALRQTYRRGLLKELAFQFGVKYSTLQESYHTHLRARRKCA